MKIGVFGAQGKFGSKLCARLTAMKPDGIDLLPTIDREHNAEIAKQCDLIILTVKPGEIEGLIKEIAPHLKDSAQILSFAAHCELQSISEQSDRPAARMMADPWWGISAYYRETEFNTSGLEFIFSSLSKLPPKELKSDKEIDIFTILITYLFTILLLHRCGEVENIDSHLIYLSQQLDIPQADLISMIPEGDPEELLATISTKGGITERITSLIRENKEINLETIV